MGKGALVKRSNKLIIFGWLLLLGILLLGLFGFFVAESLVLVALNIGLFLFTSYYLRMNYKTRKRLRNK